MQLHELKEQLTRKTLKPLYIFTGPEIAIMDIYIQKIADEIGSKLKRVDAIADIYGRIQNNSFMDQPSCYVIRDDKEYQQQDSKIWDQLNNGLLQGKNIIVLVFTNLDKRSKYYKYHADLIVDFEPLIPEVLAKYINREIGLDPKQGIKLAELCDCNYSRVLLECDKLHQLSKARKISIQSAYLMALQEKLIYTSPKDVIFQFIDAVCKRQIKLSYRLLNDLESINESPLAMISLLYNNLRSMLLVQSAGSASDMTQRTGLTAWQVKLAKDKGAQYNLQELVRAIRIIRETEKGIKTGMIAQEMSVDYILAEVL